MTPSRPWAGLAPGVDVSAPASDARAEFAQEAPPVQPEPVSPQDAALGEMGEIRETLHQLLQWQQAAMVPAALRAITFSGSGEPPILVHRDEHGPPALSIGIVNPTEAKVYLGLSGEHAAPNNHSFVVGAKQAVILPIGVSKLEIGIDPTDLGANQATIFRLRFRTVQQFFMGSL